MKRSSALLALSALALPYRAGAQALTKVTLVSTAGTAPGPAVYAEKTGLFRKYGLDVAHTQMNSGAAIVAAVVGGSADIGSGSSFSVVTAYATESRCRCSPRARCSTRPRPCRTA